MSAHFQRNDIDSNSSVFKISGVLNSKSVGPVWRQAMLALDDNPPKNLTIDTSEVEYCDGAGIGLFIELNRRQNEKKFGFEIVGLKEEFQRLLNVFDTGKGIQKLKGPEKQEDGLFVNWGKSFCSLLKQLSEEIIFIGSLSCAMIQAIRSPKKKIRWKDMWGAVIEGGIGALPIVVLINFLVGLIMAFQAAIPMKQFGADIFVADLVSLSILRELGPLMTAIVLAGRTGSAFAAELGTMKVNEEIDALHTMGLNPINFLVINRVFAVIIFMPILTLFADLAGLMGGSVVFTSFGYPMITYFNQIINAVQLHDFLGGFVKSFAFALIIASVGCLKGLETKTGASAVGKSATNAVVTGLILIILTDGIFSIIYYFLGI